MSHTDVIYNSILHQIHLKELRGKKHRPRLPSTDRCSYEKLCYEQTCPGKVGRNNRQATQQFCFCFSSSASKICPLNESLFLRLGVFFFLHLSHRPEEVLCLRKNSREEKTIDFALRNRGNNGRRSGQWAGPDLEGCQVPSGTPLIKEITPSLDRHQRGVADLRLPNPLRLDSRHFDTVATLFPLMRKPDTNYGYH